MPGAPRPSDLVRTKLRKLAEGCSENFGYHPGMPDQPEPTATDSSTRTDRDAPRWLAVPGDRLAPRRRPCPERRMLTAWLDSWTGARELIDAMNGHGYDVRLGQSPFGWWAEFCREAVNPRCRDANISWTTVRRGPALLPSSFPKRPPTPTTPLVVNVARSTESRLRLPRAGESTMVSASAVAGSAFGVCSDRECPWLIHSGCAR
jgi:hypothetical protein